jgi:hypothetical protein
MKEFFKQFPLAKEPAKNSDLAVDLMESWKYKFNRTETFQDLTPTPESRFSFWLAFGLTPDDQVALESGFSPLKVNHNLEPGEEAPSLLHFSGA